MPLLSYQGFNLIAVLFPRYMRSCFNSCICINVLVEHKQALGHDYLWHSLMARCELTVVLVGSVGCLIVSVSDSGIFACRLVCPGSTAER
jgi:hypothetical protein